jgi:hypothetical protein
VAVAVAVLAHRGVTPLWAKGWTIARHYGEPGRRATGDIDLYVAPADYERANAALALLDGPFDLHRGIPQLADRDFAAVAARAEPVAVGEHTAKVLAPADQLRLACLHALGHGAWRPLWLCDVGALVEADGIDWDLCLAGAERQAHWIACTVVAARDLLDADLSSVPATTRATLTPSWLAPALLAAWGACHHDRQPIASYWWRPLALPAALWHRWPNPIEASVGVSAAFDEEARLPLQIAACAMRIGHFAGSLLR